MFSMYQGRGWVLFTTMRLQWFAAGVACVGELAGCGGGGVAANPIPVASSSSVTTDAPTPTPSRTPAGPTFADPMVMVAKAQAAGLGLVQCGKPFLNLYQAVAVRCFMPDSLGEFVEFAVYDRPQDQAAALPNAVGQGFRVFQGSGWWVLAGHRQATLDALSAAMLR